MTSSTRNRETSESRFVPLTIGKFHTSFGPSPVVMRGYHAVRQLLQVFISVNSFLQSAPQTTPVAIFKWKSRGTEEASYPV